MQVEQQFFVGVQDVDANNAITDKALLEALTNVAYLHAAKIGQATHQHSDHSLVWVVLNWKLEVYQRPKVCETFLARTWGQKYSRMYANRDFEVLREDGTLAALVTSRWVAVDQTTGTMYKCDEDLMTPYEPEPDKINFPEFKFRKLKAPGEPLRSMQFKTTPSMIDINNHVHNPAYLEYARAILPEELVHNTYDSLEVEYRAEVKPDEVVTIEYREVEGKHIVSVLDSEGHTHATIALAHKVESEA